MRQYFSSSTTDGTTCCEMPGAVLNFMFESTSSWKAKFTDNQPQTSKAGTFDYHWQN